MPIVTLRVDDETKAAWEAEADERGVPLSELVRFSVNSEVGRLAIMNSDDGEQEPVKASGEDGGAAFTGVPMAADPGCPHPKDQRRVLGFGTWCDACGGRIR